MYISIRIIVSKDKNLNDMGRYCIHSYFFQYLYVLKYIQIYGIKFDCIPYVFIPVILQMSCCLLKVGTSQMSCTINWNRINLLMLNYQSEKSLSDIYMYD